MIDVLVTIGGWAFILAVIATCGLLLYGTVVWAWQDRGPKPPQAGPR